MRRGGATPGRPRGRCARARDAREPAGRRARSGCVRATWRALAWRSRRRSAQDPDRLAALNDLAVSYLIEGHADAARRLLDEVVASGTPREQQAALVNLGELYAAEGYVSAAQAYLETARAIDPARPEPWYALALLADGRGDLDLAASTLSEALRLRRGRCGARGVRLRLRRGARAPRGPRRRRGGRSGARGSALAGALREPLRVARGGGGETPRRRVGDGDAGAHG